MDANYRVLSIFAPILLLAGILGFVIPPDKALLSGAAPYNLFHLAAGAVGLAAVRSGGRAASRFNLVFGLIDLYQAAASVLGLFPAGLFLWTRGDDILHVLLGLILTGLGAWGLRASSSAGVPGA